jgi:hypothetical protein
MGLENSVLAMAQVFTGLFLTTQAYGRVEVVDESTFHIIAISMYTVCILALVIHTHNGTKKNRTYLYLACIPHLWFIYALMITEDGFVYTWRNIIGNMAIIEFITGVHYLCTGK